MGTAHSPAANVPYYDQLYIVAAEKVLVRTKLSAAQATEYAHLIAEHPAEWQRFCDGDGKVTGFFVGKVMKATQGKADGKVVTGLLNARK